MQIILFGGLIVQPVYKKTIGNRGETIVTHTLTNMAALKHFGGPRGIARNDNWVEHRVG